MTKSKPTKKALAAAAGVHPSTIGRVFKNHPDAPADTIATFLEFFATVRTSPKTSPEQSAEFSNERLLKLRADRQLAEEKLRVLRDGYIPKEKVLLEIGTLAAEVSRVLRYRLCRELAPTLPGLSPPEIKSRIEDLLDEIWTDHQDGTTAKMDALESETKIATATARSTRIKSRKPKKV